VALLEKLKYSYPRVILFCVFVFSLPIQAGMNSSLSRAIGHVFPITLYSFVTGAAALLICSLFTLITEPLTYNTSLETGYMWFGATVAAAAATGITIFSPILGVSVVFACIIGGSLFMSIIFDSLGTFNLPGDETQTVGALKIAGVIVAILGAVGISLEKVHVLRLERKKQQKTKTKGDASGAEQHKAIGIQ
jgi:uncharacterized membrane protein YdcZ (DUF606 family)